MKDFFTNPLVLSITLVLIVIGLVYGGKALFNAGQQSALDAVNNELANTSAHRNPDEHIRLLAKRKALQDLIAKQ